MRLTDRSARSSPGASGDRAESDREREPLRRAAVRALTAATTFARAESLPIVVFSVFFIAGVVWLLHPWHPVEDMAVTELTVRQIGPHTPLEGAYSRLPFHHPGPALFWFLWGPYQAFEQRSSALLAATIWFNGAVFAVVVGLARRLSGVWLPPLLAAGLLLWSIAGRGELFLMPWNPYVGALPMVALVLLAWALLERRRWCLPLTVALASWTVQAHIEFAPPVAALCIVGFVGLLTRTTQKDGRAGLRELVWPGVVGTGIALALWAPVIADVVAHGRSSNPAAILRYYRGPQPEAVPGTDVINVIRSQLSLRPTWSGGPVPYSFLTPGVELAPLAAPLWILAFIGASARRAWQELRGLAVTLVGFVVACGALTKISGSFGPWYLVSVEAMSITMTALVAVSLVASARWAVATLRDRSSHRDRASEKASTERTRPNPRVAAAVTGTMTVLLAAATVLSMRTSRADVRSAEVAAELQPLVEAAHPEGRPVYVVGTHEFGGWIHAALVLGLEKQGYDVYAQTALLPGKFPRPLGDLPPDDAVRFIVITDPKSTAWAPGVTVVADTTFVVDESSAPYRVYVVKAPLHGPTTTDN